MSKFCLLPVPKEVGREEWEPPMQGALTTFPNWLLNHEMTSNEKKKLI